MEAFVGDGGDELAVHHGASRLQDAPHLLLEEGGLRGRQHLVHLPSQPVPQGDQTVQGLVDPDVAQVGVQDRQADRGVGEERGEHQLAHASPGHAPEGPFRRPPDVPAEEEGGGRGDQDARDHFVDP